MVVLPYSGPLSVSAWQQALSGIGRGFHTGADRAQVEPKQRPINASACHYCVGACGRGESRRAVARAAATPAGEAVPHQSNQPDPLTASAGEVLKWSAWQAGTWQTGSNGQG